jgi:predicted hydrolase (HD superfamily)
LVCEYTESPSLRKHALSVETCVRTYGERQADALGLAGEDRAALIEKYAITGVLHDFDYERFPSLDDHPFAGSKILADLGWPEEIRTAILSHASYSGVPTNSPDFSPLAPSSNPQNPSTMSRFPASARK